MIKMGKIVARRSGILEKIFLNQKKGLECSDGSDIWKTPLYKLLCNALLRRQKYLNALRYVAKRWKETGLQN